MPEVTKKEFDDLKASHEKLRKLSFETAINTRKVAELLRDYIDTRRRDKTTNDDDKLKIVLAYSERAARL